MPSLLEKFRTRKAAAATEAGALYQEILLRSASPAAGDDEALVKVAADLGLSESDIAADVQAVQDHTSALASLAAKDEAGERRKHANACQLVETHAAEFEAIRAKLGAAQLARGASETRFHHIDGLKGNLSAIEKRAERVFGNGAIDA